MNQWQNQSKHCLAFLPTPFYKLSRFSTFFNGPEIFIKRDDQTGLTMGGNKTRKLEYLLGDALDKGKDTIITAGAPQSNHCRQTAAAAAHCGLSCHLVLAGNGPQVINGNILLDLFCGAHLHWTSSDKTEKMSEIAERIKQNKANPYVIPIGGSNGIGALGYVQAMAELTRQLEENNQKIDFIVCATSSGGTQAGLELGARLCRFEGKILGICVDKKTGEQKSLGQELADIANDSAKILAVEQHFLAKDFLINEDYLGEGYAILGEPERNAIKVLANREGILLDPVYSGRAMAGLIDLIAKNYFQSEQKILFWHTGGTPALFAYSNQFGFEL